MENPPFEDVFPIQDGDFPLLCLFTGGYFFLGPKTLILTQGSTEPVVFRDTIDYRKEAGMKQALVLRNTQQTPLILFQQF